MLWDLIRDFFVMNVFGGCTSTGAWFQGCIGYVGTYLSDGTYDDYMLGNISDLQYVVSSNPEITTTMNLGDWLSTTATIISISIIVIMCCLFIYKIIRLIGGLIR